MLAPTSERVDVAPAESPAVVTNSGPAEPPTPKVVESVQYIRAPVTRYPPQSRKLRQQGVVVLEVLVDERGLPARIRLEKSSGYQLLDAAAREAMARARFRPYTEDGVPRSVVVLVPLRFALNRLN
jgi:periplasmic protein TonB